MIKIIFVLFVCSILTYDLQYNPSTNIVWLINKNVLDFKQLEFDVVKNVSYNISNEIYYGYISNLCINSYTCCNDYKDFNYSLCNNYMIYTCDKQCNNKYKCENYSSNIYINYLLSFNSPNDVKCFKKFLLNNFSLSIQTNLNENEYSFDFTNLTDNINEYYTEGYPIYSNYLFSCFIEDLQKINLFYYNLNVFSQWKYIIKTNKIDCLSGSLQWSSNYIDYNEKEYNKLIHLNSYITTNNYFTYILNEDIQFNISNYFVKELNKGCLFYNIYYNIVENKKYFHFDIECFNDTFTFINFGIIFENGDDINYNIFLDDNKYDFILNSWELPLSFICFINEQEIDLIYFYNDKKIITTNVLQGNNDNSKNPTYVFQLNSWFVLSIISSGILVIIILFLLIKHNKHRINKILLSKWMKFNKKVDENEESLIIKEDEETQNDINNLKQNMLWLGNQVEILKEKERQRLITNKNKIKQTILNDEDYLNCGEKFNGTSLDVDDDRTNFSISDKEITKYNVDKIKNIDYNNEKKNKKLRKKNKKYKEMTKDEEIKNINQSYFNTYEEINL